MSYDDTTVNKLSMQADMDSADMEELEAAGAIFDRLRSTTTDNNKESEESSDA